VTQRSLDDDVTAALKALGVALAPATLDAALQAAERESLSHLEFLHRLLAEPAEARKQRALDRRLRDAKFRELTTLEGFDWAFNAKGVDRRGGPSSNWPPATSCAAVRTSSW
jgi:DNA replication protein DnaC